MMPPLSPEDALQHLEEDATKDNEAEENCAVNMSAMGILPLCARSVEGKEREGLTEPNGRDGRLLRLLGPHLPVGVRLAAAGVLVLDELCVRASLLGSLGLRVVVSSQHN